MSPRPSLRKLKRAVQNRSCFLHDRNKDRIDEDDPYKDYPIPDDLEW
ncbi:MAG: DUF2058 family protein [Candidatus Azotimanducaceae bacterium]